MAQKTKETLSREVVIQEIVDIQNVFAGVCFPKEEWETVKSPTQECFNTIIPPLLDRLRVTAKYIMFDREATLRQLSLSVKSGEVLLKENKDLKQTIQEMFDNDQGEI